MKDLEAIQLAQAFLREGGVHLSEYGPIKAVIVSANDKVNSSKYDTWLVAFQDLPGWDPDSIVAEIRCPDSKTSYGPYL